MTALRDAIEHSALGWVKPELDETLRLVRVEVEGFADDPADTSRMRVCAELLHQVQGTLRMVELYAPAMVAEEMEQLSITLQHGRDSAGQDIDCDSACSALMRGVVLLPDYLERLQSGHKEISIVLLPMLNELRAARGESGLSESVLFSPDLDRALPVSLPRPTAQTASARANDVAPYLARLRDALQAWPEQDAPADADGLHFAAEALLSRTSDESQRRMLWVASMVAKALLESGIAPTPGLRQAFASVDRETRGLFDQGVFDAPRADAALEPTRQLLYHVAHSDSDHPAILKLRDVFDLDSLKPTESELDHARGSVAGRNRSLLDTVAAAVKEDLLRVKDALDLHLRTGQTDRSELQPQAEALQRVSDTLGMLGLGLARSLVHEQRDAMQEIVDGKREANESALLDIAGALLYVDASLDDQVTRLASGDGADTEDDLAGSEARKVLDILVREAITNFAGARQAFVAFVETAWSHSELESVPKLLLDVSGALNMLELPQPAQYLDGVRLYTEIELLARHRIPNSRQLDTFADALASVEYYLEALREQRANRDEILDITRNSLETLGYWPLPKERTETSQASIDVPAAAQSQEPAQPVFDVVSREVPQIDVSGETSAQPSAPDAEGMPSPQVPAIEAPVVATLPASAPAAFVPLFLPPKEPVSAPPAAAAQPPSPMPESMREMSPPAVPAAEPVSAGFDTTSDDIDDEIREIFLEEFEEEIENLAQLLPAWKTDPANIDRLQPVRRVFHTLKGSGRLVGAKTLGEFSWKIENMLNKVRDGLRPATSPVIAMVEQAYATLPQLHVALRGEGLVTADLRAMEGFADRIANGEEVMPVIAAKAVADVVPVVAFEPVVAGFSPGATVEEEEGIPVSVDVVLFEILQAEVAGHLATINTWLMRAQSEPSVADEALVRAIHTMNGAFAMTEVPAITDALSPAEGYVRRLLSSADAAEPEGVSAIAELSGRVQVTIEAIAVSGGRVPPCDDLAARFLALRDRLPESRQVGMADDFADSADNAPEAPRGIELTELDLSAYGEFDSTQEDARTKAVHDAEPVENTTQQLDVIQFDASAEDELAQLLGHSTESAPLPADVPASVPEDQAAPGELENADRLLAMMETFEAERLEAERLEAERLEAERLEAERLEAERLEAERLEAERLEAERLEAERLEAERLEAERLEAERLVAGLESHVAPPASAVPSAATAVAALVDPDLPLEMADLDSDLVDIFVEEGHDLLDHSDQLLVRLRDRPEEREVIVGLQRDLHTLKGGARMAGIMAIGELGHAMESLLEAVAEQRMQLEKQDIPLLERGFDRLHTMVTRVGDRRAVAMPDMLITAFDARAQGMPVNLQSQAAAASVPAVTDITPIVSTLPEAVDEQIGDVEQATAAEQTIEDSLSALPTFEGSEIEVEEVEATRDAPTDGLVYADEAIDPLASIELADLLDETLVDQVFVEQVPTEVENSLTDDTAEQEDVAADSDLQMEDGGVSTETIPSEAAEDVADIDAFDFDLLPEFAAGYGAVSQSGLPADVPADEEREEVSEIEAAVPAELAPVELDIDQPEAAAEQPRIPDFTPLPALRPLSAPMEFGADADEDVGLRGSQEQVRVRAELLDRLVNYAGEVAIYRSRLEQQLGAFRTATSEMDQTTNRLRDQLRRLEIETEAQIIARYQREGETRDATFDPLELDRFSNLQQLSRALSETAADLGSLHTTLDDLTQQHDTLLLQQSRVSSELQEGLMRTRMVPFDTVVPRLRRVLRQASTDTGKQVQLKLDGAQGELDRNVLERMTAPLEHMLRNSVAHGLESPADRAKAGKPEEGYVLVSIRKEGSEVVLQISDDGVGLNRDAIRARGEIRGLVRPGASLSNAQLDALILEPGFSTAEEVSRLAGRGVGMDVVASEVRQLGGTLDILSERGRGTTFTLRLPQTLAVTQAAFIRIGETIFAVPIASVRGVGRMPREELEKGEVTNYRYGNEEYVLHDLGRLLGHAPAKAEGQLQMPLLLTRSGDLHVAVTVDQIIGNREIVVKPIGPQVASIPGIFGATIMGDGSVVVILDVAPLVRRQAAMQLDDEDEGLYIPEEQRAVPLVMVVDDSITMRKVSSRVLERNNFEVVTAKDGIDALERLAERVPDLMLLDIEMPRMDGYELATTMKADPRLANIPIIMITSRTGDKHRQRAMDIGVNRYLGKPYQENELMRNVYSLLDAHQSKPVRSDA